MWKVKAMTAGLTLAAVSAFSGPAAALEVDQNISTDTVWRKSDNPVILKGPIFVENGASLTIEAGVVVVTPGPDDGGLVVERDSQIFVLGTKAQPVIMTSAADVSTWDGSVVRDGSGNPVDATDAGFETEDAVEIETLGDPKTGTWRESALEWRNLTIMGRGVIAASHFSGAAVQGSDGVNNPVVPDGSADKQMEGLTDSAQDIFYGGADDDDDSGTLSYLSIRYGGRVVGTGNELNGLSLGGIGRGTDISHVEIMNNVDDGIEVWGGTVDLKYFSIWNVGDDSFDFDQGWRGRGQFGLIVQGASLDASQGSGVGDNAVEHDGAEAADAQPRTTTTLYNLTVIGNPGGTADGGDGLTTWRDNARVQYRKSIFMDAGETLVRFDNNDGDTGSAFGGYGLGGTHRFDEVWTTPASNLSPNNVNDGTGDFSPSSLYTAQLFDGNLAELRDSVIFNVPQLVKDTSDPSDAPVVDGPGGELTDFLNTGLADWLENQQGNAVDAAGSGAMPIQSIVRAGEVLRGGKSVVRVTELDPRAAGDATDSDDALLPPLDGFWTPADFRGVASAAHNPFDGWGAAEAYGFFPGEQSAEDPAASFEVRVSTTTFQTQVGESYVIEGSSDGRDWDPVAVVEGDGTLKTVANEITPAANMFYRVLVQ